MNKHKAREDYKIRVAEDMSAGENILDAVAYIAGHCDGQRSKPKRTISLEAYIKMQNDWLINTLVQDGNNFSTYDKIAKSAVDELLVQNNVEVGE